MTETFNTIGWLMLAVAFALLFVASTRSKKIEKLETMTELLEANRFDEADKRIVALKINIVLAATALGLMVFAGVSFLAGFVTSHIH